MRITRAVGLVLALAMLKFLIPDVISGMTNTLTVFFATVTLALNQSQQAMLHGLTLLR
ncbi:MAG: hypothetical protein WC757_02355 [Candidatus Paceibacterota bacterium]|jgi:hypothetical protein